MKTGAYCLRVAVPNPGSDRDVLVDLTSEPDLRLYAGENNEVTRVSLEGEMQWDWQLYTPVANALIRQFVRDNDISLCGCLKDAALKRMSILN